MTAARDHPRTGQTAFFNNVVSRFLNALDKNTLNPPHINDQGRLQPPAFVSLRPCFLVYEATLTSSPKYGDDGIIPQEYLESAVKFIKETRALISWTPGDVVLLDVGGS